MTATLKARSESYSPEVWLRLRRHIFRAIRFGILWFGILGSLLAYFTWYIWQGADEGFVGLASVTTGILLASIIPAFGRLQDLVVTPPNLIAYFDGRVPGCGLVSGFELLRHSRALDSLAEANGLKRIGEFVSDDDFFDRSGPTWHTATDALTTFDGLLRLCESDSSLQAAKQDLEEVRDRLRFAESAGIQFCLLLRDVHGTNQMEWDQRKGKC